MSIAQLEQQLDSAPDDIAQVRATNALAWALRQRDVVRAEKLAVDAQAICEAMPLNDEHAVELVRSLRTQAFVNAVLGRYPQALAAASRGLDHPMVTAMPEERIELLNSSSWCLGINGSHAYAIERLLLALDLARELGSEIRQSRVLNSIGSIYSIAGDSQRAVDALEQALAMATQASSAMDRSLMLNNLALAYLDLDRTDEAYVAARQSLEIASLPENGLQRVAILDTVAEICLARGNTDEALAYLNESLTMARAVDSRIDLCTGLLHRSQAYLAQNNLEAALGSAIEGIGVAYSINATHEHYLLHETLSQIHERMGDEVEALRHYRLFHQAREELFGQEAGEKLRNLRAAFALEAARKDAEIHQLRNVELEQEIAERRQAEKRLQETVTQLQAALDDVKTLSGLLPICASCKRIRTDDGYWESVEQYVSSHTDAQFSHGICPECAIKLYGELDWPTDGEGNEQEGD